MSGHTEDRRAGGVGGEVWCAVVSRVGERGEGELCRGWGCGVTGGCGQMGTGGLRRYRRSVVLGLRESAGVVMRSWAGIGLCGHGGVKKIKVYGGTERELMGARCRCLGSGEGLAVLRLGVGKLGSAGGRGAVRCAVDRREWGLSRGSGVVRGVWGEPGRDRGEQRGGE